MLPKYPKVDDRSYQGLGGKKLQIFLLEVTLAFLGRYYTTKQFPGSKQLSSSDSNSLAYFLVLHIQITTYILQGRY